MSPIDRKISRIRLGLDQKTVARMVGCHRTVISMMERPGYDVRPELEHGYDRLLKRLEAEAAGNE